MSQNGHSRPPGDGADQPYSEPADPWGELAAPVPPDPQWSATHQAVPPATALSSGWTPPAESAFPRPPQKRNKGMLALVVALGVLVAVGIGVAGWLLQGANNDDDKKNQAQASTATTQQTQQTPVNDGSNNGYTVKQGDCVGVDAAKSDDAQPTLRKSVCASGAYKILKRIDGKTSGKTDAIAKCASVDGYTDYFFYDSAYDDLDYVLCLQKLDN